MLATSEVQFRVAVGRQRVAARRLVVMAAALIVPATAFAQEQPAVLPLFGSQLQPRQSAAAVGQRAGPQARRPLPQQISAMPAVTEDLDVIQHRSQLIVTRTNIVRTAVANPSVVEIVQYSPNEISIIGLEIGATTLTLWFENSPEPLIYLVNTIRDPSLEDRRRFDCGKLERKLGILFPDSKVSLIPFSGKIVVKGQARDSEEAAHILQIIRGEVVHQEGSLRPSQQPPPGANVTGDPRSIPGPLDPASTSIVNMLEVPGEFQVMLRVRIAELNRAQLRRMGVDLNDVLFRDRRAVRLPAADASAMVAGVSENGKICAALHWMASNGTAKILSEPVLTVISGHSASFLSGGEFAVPTIVGVDGVGAQQTTFRGFGTSLTVTPTVLDHDLIRLAIAPEFSALSTANAVNGIPGVNTRRVQTTVQLREGQTIVLAGLIVSQSNAVAARVPFLGDIPHVGPRLFAGKRATQDESELLILVTPELVRPMDADEVPPVPGHEVTHPNDSELYHHAMTEGAPDSGVYQIAPYGTGQSVGVQVGYRPFSPANLSLPNSPIAIDDYGAGYSAAPNGGETLPPRGPLPANRRAAPPASPLAPPQTLPFRTPAGPTDPTIVPPPSGATDSNGESIQQTSASIVGRPTGARSETSSANKGWFQGSFRSFSRPKATPQRSAAAPAANDQRGQR